MFAACFNLVILINFHHVAIQLVVFYLGPGVFGVEVAVAAEVVVINHLSLHLQPIIFFYIVFVGVVDVIVAG